MTTATEWGDDVRTAPTKGDRYYTWPHVRGGVTGVAKLCLDTVQRAERCDDPRSPSHGESVPYMEYWDLYWIDTDTDVRYVDIRIERGRTRARHGANRVIADPAAMERYVESRSPLFYGDHTGGMESARREIEAMRETVPAEAAEILSACLA